LLETDPQVSLKLAESGVAVEDGEVRVLDYPNEQGKVLLHLLHLSAQLLGDEQLGF